MGGVPVGICCGGKGGTRGAELRVVVECSMAWMVLHKILQVGHDCYSSFGA